MQADAKKSVDSFAAPDADGIASVMNIVLPGKTRHPVIAMVSNRTYGLDSATGQTVQPQPFSLVGDGAGSIFKIFTTAAALDLGLGINANLDVPGRFEAKGLGKAGRRGCPKETWCVRELQRPPVPDDEGHRRAGKVTQHRVRQSSSRRSELPARWTWPSAWGCGPTPSPAPPAAMTPTTTRAWRISSSARTSARSPWALSR